MKAETESALAMLLLIDQLCFATTRIFDLTLTKSLI
jgi:hypothetical protein